MILGHFYKMDTRLIQSRMNNRLLHLGIERGRDALPEKDLYPWMMYLRFRLKKFVKHIPVAGPMLRRFYLRLRYGIRLNDGE